MQKFQVLFKMAATLGMHIVINTKSTFQTWKIKTSKYKDKSKKCSKSCTIETSYKSWTQNLKVLDGQDLIISKDEVKRIFIFKENTHMYK